jgi:tetratricopeptide (TPR) repeat protein
VQSQRTLLDLVNTGQASGEVYNLLGAVEMKTDLFTDAVKSYSRAVELNPNAVGAQVGLASAKWAAGLRPEAEAQFQFLLRQHPDNASVYESYGTSLLNAAVDDTMLAQAAELLNKAVKLDASRAEPHYQLGILELKKTAAPPNLLRQALEQLQIAARLGLTDSRIHYALARVYRRLGREDEAAAETQLYQKAQASEGRPEQSRETGALQAK